jgi:hypothetical protein
MLPVAIFLSTALFACRADPAPDAGFIENPSVLKQGDKLPFNSVWFKENIDLRTYRRVYVAPVDTEHLLKMSWWDKASLASATNSLDPRHEARFLADYFRSDLVEKLRAYPELTVIDKHEPDALIIELAIVELVPAKVWLNTIGYATLGPVSFGSTAIEGRFRDGSSKNVLGKFKDRELGQADLISVADLQWYSHSKHMLSRWSDKIVEVMEREPNSTVDSISTFTLRPW